MALGYSVTVQSLACVAGSWVLRFIDTSARVPTVFSGVQQGRRGRKSNELIADDCFVCSEPKAGPRNGATEDCAMRSPVVGMGDVDVKMEGSVWT